MVDVEKTVVFTEFQEPKLKAGEYSIQAQLLAGPTATQTSFQPVIKRFAVIGPRFQLGGDDLVSLFPLPNGVGEFAGVLPHAVLSKPTLPWLRDCVSGAAFANVPWLAVLTLQEDEIVLQQGQTTPVVRRAAADLVPLDVPITVAGGPPPPPGSVGKMPAGTVSYPGFEMLNYGESPTDPVNTIDLSIALFSRIAPTATDLPLLANVRTTDTQDSVDNTDSYVTRAVVLGNRVGAAGQKASAFLVSLENLGAFLPDDSGTPSSQFGSATTIRLTVLASWSFTPTAGGASLVSLLTDLNVDGVTSLRVGGATVDPTKVAQAAADEATGISADDADAMAANAVAAGFVPLSHHLREAGQTVSWYRGPLIPYSGLQAYPLPSVTSPDALLRYDPRMGMFDASYAAAWQLGQLLGLSSRAYSTALFQWKQQVARFQAVAADQATFAARLNPPGLVQNAVPLQSFIRRLSENSSNDAPEPPSVVVDFIAALRLLKGIPFSYLVPDEAMLPPESLRIFSLDPNWIEAVVDGAMSIGRTSELQRVRDVALAETLRPLSISAARRARCNDRPHLALAKAQAGTTDGAVTGFIIRSQAIRGWPSLQVDGYSDTDDSHPPDVAKLRMALLSPDVLLCLFDGTVKMVAIHEPPEQLHSGFEFDSNGANTTLRALSGPTPGLQYPTTPNGLAPISLRADKLTMQAVDSGNAIMSVVNTHPNQNVTTMTANEFALEMVKGVVRVEYIVGGP